MGRRDIPMEVRFKEKGLERAIKEVLRTERGDFVLADQSSIAWRVFQDYLVSSSGKKFPLQPVKLLQTSSPIEARLRVNPDEDVYGAEEFINAILFETINKKEDISSINGFYFAGENSWREMEYHRKGGILSGIDLKHNRDIVAFLCRYEEIPYHGANTLRTPDGGTIFFP